MHSNAKTVAEYIENLHEDRKAAITQVRDVIVKNLPPGIVESMNYGMIVYQVPLAHYPDTYNKQPLMYAALASQKNHMAVYLTNIYSNERTKLDFIAQYKATGKKMDIGKSCVRFKKLENLPLELIGKAIAATDMDTFILMAREARKGRKK